MDGNGFDRLVAVVEADRHAQDQSRSGLRRSATVFTVAAIALMAAAFGRGILIDPVVVPTASMDPTIEAGTHVIVLSNALYRDAAGPGDVVVFADPANGGRQLIKRVLATAGQTIEASDGTVLVDGEALEEPWLPEATTSDFDPVLIAPHHLFVMGDNRSGSTDSRVFGAIAEADVVGRAGAAYWPFPEFRVFDGP